MLERLGSFMCSTGTLVVSDPCYVELDAGSVDVVTLRVENAAPGRWDVWHEWHDDPEAPTPRQPRGLIARSAAVPDDAALTWREITRDLCTDIGQAGIFDAGFFRGGLAAAGREVRSAYLQPSQAWIGDGGANSLCCFDPIRVAVAVAEEPGGRIVGVRTTWYSKCIRLRSWTHVVDGEQVVVTLDSDGLETVLPSGECDHRWFAEFGSVGHDELEQLRGELGIPPAIWGEIVAVLRARGILEP